MLSVERVGTTMGVSAFCLESQCWISWQSDFIERYLNVHIEMGLLFITIGNGRRKVSDYPSVPTMGQLLACIIRIILPRECKFHEDWSFGLFCLP